MDPKDFLEKLSLAYPKAQRLRLISECFQKYSNLPIKLNLANNQVITGSLKKNSSISNLSIFTESKQQKYDFAAIIYFILRSHIKNLKTDGEISKKKNSIRSLKQWSHEGPDVSLESEDRNWNQFETNEKRFGVVSTYKEEFYTTKKVPLSSLSEDQIKRAIKIEKEINKRGGKELEEEDEDEEKMFGAVLGSGRYVEKAEEHLAPMRERATSMATSVVSSIEFFTKDEYKQTREYLMNPHRSNKERSGPQIDTLDALNLNIVVPELNEEEQARMIFYKFKQDKLKADDRNSVLKELQSFSKQLKSNQTLGVIEEEEKVKLPKSLVDIFLRSWKNSLISVNK